MLIFFAWSRVICSKDSHIIFEVCLCSSQIHLLGRKKLYSSFSVQYVSCQHFICFKYCLAVDSSCHWVCILSLFSKPFILFFLQKQSMFIWFFSNNSQNLSWCAWLLSRNCVWHKLVSATDTNFSLQWTVTTKHHFLRNIDRIWNKNPLFHFFMRRTLSLLLWSLALPIPLLVPSTRFFPVLLASSQSGQSDSFLFGAQAISSSCFNFLALCNLVPSCVSFWHFDNSFSLIHQIQGFFCFPSLLQWCSCNLSFTLLCMMSLPSVTSLNVSCLLWIQLLHFLNCVLTPSFQPYQPFPLRSQFPQDQFHFTPFEPLAAFKHLQYSIFSFFCSSLMPTI